MNANPNLKKQKCQHKKIWFNPLLSENVKTNLGKVFFELLKRGSAKPSKMFKNFNENTLKLSYSCCTNISFRNYSNNQRIINPPPTNHGCNYRNKCDCPLDDKCLAPSIVYKAIVSAANASVKSTLEYQNFL